MFLPFYQLFRLPITKQFCIQLMELINSSRRPHRPKTVDNNIRPNTMGLGTNAARFFLERNKQLINSFATIC